MGPVKDSDILKSVRDNDRKKVLVSMFLFICLPDCIDTYIKLCSGVYLPVKLTRYDFHSCFL